MSTNSVPCTSSAPRGNCLFGSPCTPQYRRTTLSSCNDVGKRDHIWHHGPGGPLVSCLVSSAPACGACSCFAACQCRVVCSLTSSAACRSCGYLPVTGALACCAVDAWEAVLHYSPRLALGSAYSGRVGCGQGECAAARAACACVCGGGSHLASWHVCSNGVQQRCGHCTRGRWRKTRT